MLQERLAQLEQQHDQLQMQLDEIKFLINGYRNTIKAQEDKASNADEAEASED